MYLNLIVLVLIISVVVRLLLYLAKRRSPQEMKEDARAAAVRITPRSALRFVEANVASAILCLAGICTAMCVAGFVVEGVDDGAIFMTGCLGFMVAIPVFLLLVFLYHTFKFARIAVRSLDVAAIVVFGALFLKSMIR